MLFPVDADDEFRPDDDPEQSMLGLLAARFGLIDAPSFYAAIARFKPTAKGARPPLGEILKDLGYLTDKQIKLLVQIQSLLLTRFADRQFAEMVLETGYVSVDEVDYAFAAQEAAFRKDRTVKRIGEFLVEFGAIDAELRDTLFAQQGRTPLAE